MNERSPPVTRLMTLRMVAESLALQRAMSPGPRLKCAKLWNRLSPARTPPPIVVVAPSVVAVVPVLSEGSVSGAIAVCAVNASCAATGIAPAASASAALAISQRLIASSPPK
ncbi:hypothetical protein IP68_05340 [Blastomonas sp. AAP25]|nr:hypothetical protein IP68_05340 [Blastomonas sp. AAP25]